MSRADIKAELEAFIKSGNATAEVNSGNFVTTHIDTLKVAEHFYEQAIKDIWHNVKDEQPIDGERLLLINRNGEHGTVMLMTPILQKEFSIPS